MKRLLLIPVALLAVTETYRRGYGSALVFGARLWVSARPGSTYEDDVVA